MKRVIGIVGVLGVVVAACMAGVRTDKIVFEDETEMSTASGGAGTNTATVQFSQGVYVDGDAEGFDTYIGKDEATDYALRTTDGMNRTAKLSGNTMAGEFGDGTHTAYLCDGMYAASLMGAFYQAGDVPSWVMMGYDDDDDVALKAEQGNCKAWLGSASTAGNFTDGTRQVYLADGMYAVSVSGPFYLQGDVPGISVSMSYDDDDDAGLKVENGANSKAMLMTSSAAGEFTDGTAWAYLADGIYAGNFQGGPVRAADDVTVEIEDAAGTGTSWMEWAIYSSQNQDGNWRMGVVNSNFVIQVRVSGTWTDATVLTRP